MEFQGSEGIVERECLLLEAGEYPDRGVTITPEDLAAIVDGTPAETPVRVEHLGRSPFDAALGSVVRLRADGERLWGVLRQPAVAWEFVRKAGARALSVALDVANRRLTEVSFVCHPRVAAARVFGGSQVLFETTALFDGHDEGRRTADGSQQRDDGAPIVRRPSSIVHETEDQMMSVRQLAEGVIQSLRAMAGAGEEPPDEARFAVERAALAEERESVRESGIDQQMADLKRRGLVLGTDSAEALARAILRFGESQAVSFGGEEAPLARIFARFLEENGAVVPMGEVAQADPAAGRQASDQLITLAREWARRDGTSYVTAFAQAATAHPDLARAAREETL